MIALSAQPIVLWRLPAASPSLLLIEALLAFPYLYMIFATYVQSVQSCAQNVPDLYCPSVDVDICLVASIPPRCTATAPNAIVIHARSWWAATAIMKDLLARPLYNRTQILNIMAVTESSHWSSL